jgi:hypothetical protein
MLFEENSYVTKRIKLNIKIEDAQIKIIKERKRSTKKRASFLLLLI